MIESLGLTKNDLQYNTYQEVLDALASFPDKYLPTITIREKVILITARIDGRASKEFEESFVPNFKHGNVKDHIKLSNEFVNKYGFIREHDLYTNYQDIQFDYELAYRIKVGNHNKYMMVKSFDESDGFFNDMSNIEYKYLILDYTPELELFLKDFQEAIYKLSKKLLDFFVELKDNPNKCITNHKKILEIGNSNN